MRCAIFKISFALALWLAAGALAPAPIHAAAESVQLADSHDLIQRRELQRLQEERQKALDKAAQSRKRRTRRSRSRVQKTSQPRQRLTLSLPLGWSSGEAVGVFKDAALGDSPGFSKARTEKTVYSPGGGPGKSRGNSPELIVVERFGKSQSNNKTLSLEHVYRRWREKVNAGCADGRETGPDDSDQDGQAVIDSYYACAKRKSDGRAEVSMMKVIDGAAELFVVSRARLAPPPGTTSGAGRAPDMDAVIDEWRAWSAAAAKVDILAAAKDGANVNRADSGEKVTKGYGFVVGRTGHLLTPHSLVEDCKGVRFSSLAAELVASDPDQDLALYKLGTRPKAVAVFRKGTEAILSDTVALPSYRPAASTGADASIELSVTTGVISALIGPGGDPRFLSVTAAIPSGNSGLPLVDLGGIVAGMAMARANAMKISASPPGVPAAANFALSAKVLKRFLDKHRVVYETSNVGAILSPGEAASRARSATVLVECRN